MSVGKPFSAFPAGPALLHIGTEIAAEHREGFNQWCEAHVRSNLELPGVLACRRFAATAWQGAGDCPTEITLYDLEAESALHTDAYASHDQSVPSPYREALQFQRNVYHEIGTRTEPGQQQVGSAILHVYVDVEPGHHEAFLDWYANEHVPAVLSAPGMIAARRFAAADAEKGAPLAPGQHSYFTLYEMEDAEVITRPETLEASARGACPPQLEPYRVASNRVYTEILRVSP